VRSLVGLGNERVDKHGDDRSGGHCGRDDNAGLGKRAKDKEAGPGGRSAAISVSTPNAMTPGMLPTHDVDCPKCGKFVYTALSLEDVLAPDAPTSPKAQTDARGDYLPCPHWGFRIPMKRITTKAGVGFRVADETGK
jgi:hypothetical protein